MPSLRLPALSLCFALVALPSVAGEDHGHDEHVSEAAGVRIVHAWTPATGHDHARVYMEIENGSGDPVTITGGETEIGGAVALMGAPIKASESEAVALGEYTVPAGGDMALEPATMFLMIDGLTAPLAEGDAFHMHVMLEPVGEIEVEVAVEAEGATQHSHAGHSH